MANLKPKRILGDGTAVKTNLIARDTFPGDELTDQEKKEYDYLLDELDGSAFFRFKGRVYGIHEFELISESSELYKAGWRGMAAQSAFHGVVISLDSIHEVVVGQVFS
jgi:cytoplasmic iron level regulating protein YaaA (DUF328/UPF0246 family)